MALGRKTGGRVAGTPNKRSLDARDVFIKLGGPEGRDYAAQLHQLATAKHDDPHVRIKALAIIAPYLWGKPTERVEVTGQDGGPISIVHNYAMASEE